MPLHAQEILDPTIRTWFVSDAWRETIAAQGGSYYGIGKILGVRERNGLPLTFHVFVDGYSDHLRHVARLRPLDGFAKAIEIRKLPYYVGAVEIHADGSYRLDGPHSPGMEALKELLANYIDGRERIAFEWNGPAAREYEELVAPSFSVPAAPGDPGYEVVLASYLNAWHGFFAYLDNVPLWRQLDKMPQLAVPLRMPALVPYRD